LSGVRAGQQAGEGRHLAPRHDGVMTEWPDIRATYDAVAKDYAAAFAGELAAKPFDRALLDDFAAACHGRVFDVGCGAAGHVTRFLADQGADVVGVDLSPASIEVARASQPGLRFEVADMRDLLAPDASLAGLVAFYSVIHLPRPQVPVALAEFRRVLQRGGVLLMAMHGGTGEMQSDDWFGQPVSVRASLWSLAELTEAVQAAGFVVRRHCARQPYQAEHPTERLYVWAEAS
jgi:SAM-dependent methyltransferase